MHDHLDKAGIKQGSVLHPGKKKIHFRSLVPEAGIAFGLMANIPRPV